MRNDQLKGILLKDLKKKMQELGLQPPYMWELKRKELLEWMDKYLTVPQFDNLVQELTPA